MLNSWFGKDHDKTKNSIAHSDIQRIPIKTTDVPEESLQNTQRTPPIGFTSPHDAVLAHMRGQPHVEDTEDGILREETSQPHKEEQHLEPNISDSASHPSSAQKDSVVYDPFEGTPIGLMGTSPFVSSRLAHSTGAFTGSGDRGSKEEQWEHLSKVLDLQNELARMHLEMEGGALGDGKGKATGKGRARGKSRADTNAWSDFARDRKAKRQLTTDTIGPDGHEGDEEGVDAAGDEEIEMKKAREEQFSSMADQFEGRKESIQAIMGKLDQLSKVLTQFHTLQAPTFEFSKTGSRQNSMTPDATPPQVQPKVTPYMSATLPNATLPSVSNAHSLQPVLPSISNSPGSLSSTPQPILESVKSDIILPASLSRFKPGNAVEPLIVNMMEPGKQLHVVDSPDSLMRHTSLPLEG